jgi:uncharacterized protein (TIRG00374 family)
VARWSSGRIVRLVVAASLTLFVLWKANPSEVVRAVSAANPKWLAAAILLVIVDRALMAHRWIVLLCPIDAAARPPIRALMHLFFVSTFVGTFLPASVGGDAVRAYGLARWRIGAGAAVASVLMDRLLGAMSIVIVGVVGLVAVQAGGVRSIPAVSIALALATAACVLGSLVVFSESVARATATAAGNLPFATLRRLALELTQATRAYARYHAELAGVLAGSVAVQMLRVIQAYCLGRALTIETPLALYFTVIPLILLVMLLPVSINGIGTSQVAFVWFFGRIGVPAPAAFALSVLFVALGVVGNLPGGVLYALAPPTHESDRQARPR